MRLSLSFLMLFLLQISCGGVDQVEIKDFRLFFHTDNEDLVEESDRLIASYNDRMGFIAIKRVENVEDSNSSVTFVEGLVNDGKLGYGQWLSSTHTESGATVFKGHKPKKTTSYAMSLEFDLQFFLTRAGKSSSDPEHQRLFVLFSHEVGHGLQMDHHDNKSDVMYPVINEAKSYNLTSYFVRARAFFQ